MACKLANKRRIGYFATPTGMARIYLECDYIAEKRASIQVKDPIVGAWSMAQNRKCKSHFRAVFLTCSTENQPRRRVTITTSATDLTVKIVHVEVTYVSALAIQ